MVANKYNTFWKRVAASFIDSFVLFPFALLDYFFGDTNIKVLFIFIALVNLTFSSLYFIICHGRYGHTFGKRLVGIKVLDSTETKVIGYKRAFLRESVWILSELGLLIYFIISTYKLQSINEDLTNDHYTDLVTWFTMIWFFLELVTMLFNNKRRAIHDFIAGSVVVNQNPYRERWTKDGAREK